NVPLNCADAGMQIVLRTVEAAASTVPRRHTSASRAFQLSPLSHRYHISPSRYIRRSIHDHASDALAGMHQVEALVDVLGLQRVGGHRVDLDLAGHVPVDDFRHVGATARAAEGGAFPDAAGDELERARGDFLTGAGDADD